MRKSHNAFLPDAGGRVTIGDNVFLGMNAIVLKGVTIGSNVIVGAGSVVTHDLPENTVCAGNPCHVICSLDDYCKRKAEGIVDDVYHLYYFLQQTRNRKPTPEDLLYFGYLFTKPESDERRSFAERIRLVADDDKEVRENYLYLKNIFSDFQDFEEYCQRRRKQENGEDEGVLCDT